MDSLKMKKKGQATFEYVTVLILVMAVFMLFSYYIKRAIAGRWKTSADMVGEERIFDASGPVTGTRECAFLENFAGIGAIWYSPVCYQNNKCGEKCFGFEATHVGMAECRACIEGCRDPMCDTN